MKLPIPKAHHVEQMQTISREHYGVELSPEQAFEVLSNLVHFVYLTEYYGPDNPLRPRPNEETATDTAPGTLECISETAIIST